MSLLKIKMTDPSICLLSRMLTDRQRALMMSYAEDETDVEGTVNGVTSTTAGSGSSVTSTGEPGALMLKLVPVFVQEGAVIRLGQGTHRKTRAFSPH